MRINKYVKFNQLMKHILTLSFHLQKMMIDLQTMIRLWSLLVKANSTQENSKMIDIGATYRFTV